MSTFIFESYIDYEDGRMAHVYTMEDDDVSGVPLNIHIDNTDLYPALKKCLCEMTVCGIAGDLDIYTSSDEYKNAGTGFTEKSLIPAGTFPLPGKEESFKPSAHIIFSGKVLDVMKNPDDNPNKPNYCLWIETLGFCFALYLRDEGLIEEGYVVSGSAWLFGDITDIISPIEYKMKKSAGRYVLLTARNNSNEARYKGRIDEFFLSGKYQIPCVRGHFIGVGTKTFVKYDLIDIVPLAGKEEDIIRGRVTGETIQDYILPLTDEQLVFLATELDIDLEDLPFLPEDGIEDVHNRLVEIKDDEKRSAEAEGRELSERGRTAEVLEAIIGNKLTEING